MLVTFPFSYSLSDEVFSGVLLLVSGVKAPYNSKIHRVKDCKIHYRKIRTIQTFYEQTF